MPKAGTHASVPFLHTQCVRLGVSSKGTKAELTKRLQAARAKGSGAPHARNLESIESRVTELCNTLNTTSRSASPDSVDSLDIHLNLDEEINAITPLLRTSKGFDSSSSSLARLLKVMLDPIVEAFKAAHLFPLPVSGKQREHIKQRITRVRNTLDSLRTASPPPMSQEASPDTTCPPPTPETQPPGPVPAPDTAEPGHIDAAMSEPYAPPGQDALAWSCQVDPVEYGETIRHAITFLDKKSSRCGHRTMVKAVAAEQAQMAELLGDDSQFENVRLSFVNHVVDMLEFAAERALCKGNMTLHKTRLRHKADFVQAFNELATASGDAYKADPTRKFLKVIIMAALGRLFSLAQTAAFKHMGIPVLPSFFGLAPQRQGGMITGTPTFTNTVPQRNQNTFNNNVNPRPPPPRHRERILGQHTPNATEIIGNSTPGAVHKSDSTCTCGASTHDSHECQQAWWNKYKRTMQGFVNQGCKWVKDPALWNGANAAPALGKLWLAVLASGKCKESPYGPTSKRAPPDFQAITNQDQ